MLRLAELSGKAVQITERAKDVIERTGKELVFSDDADSPIRLVFAGQYSAGKSTILKMLTGDSSIETGAGITTQQANSYQWNGLEVIDTPGIHTQLRPDHDAISYQAIMSADMLVFVITNELFDDHLANHFRSLAIDKDKAGEMLLVVNKMERTSNGNTEEQQNVIREDLRKVLAPYTPEDLGISFVDAETYLDSLAERENDQELADELLERSGYDSFVEALNLFVKEKSLTSRLTTKLYEINEQLEECIKETQPQSLDEDVDALEENFMQQRHELTDSRNRLQQAISDIYTKGARELRTLGLTSSNLITEGCKQDDVEAELEAAAGKANEIIENCQSEALSTLESGMTEIGQVIDAIENSEFTQRLIAKLEEKFDILPDNIKGVLVNAGAFAQKAGNALVHNAYNATAQGGLKLANFSGGNVHNVILKAGHALGYKFKPWQAIKLAKGVAVAGQVLGALGVGLSVFMQIKEDRDEEKRKLEIKTNRQNIRSQFYTAASELEDHGRSFISEYVELPLNSSIDSLDYSIREIRDTRSGKNELCLELEAVQRDCQELIKEIHKAS